MHSSARSLGRSAKAGDYRKYKMRRKMSSEVGRGAALYAHVRWCAITMHPRQLCVAGGLPPCPLRFKRPRIGGLKHNGNRTCIERRNERNEWLIDSNACELAN